MLVQRIEPTTLIRTVHGFGYAFAGEAGEGAPTTIAATRHWIICSGPDHPSARSS
ncbi:MAG TPA: hypothetical protein VHU82_09725 [Vicinamibacterales bacterium]|nr:hypothetical protein [Vicinamibacterales bacterium]